MKFYICVLILIITASSCSKLSEDVTLVSGVYRTQDSVIAKIALCVPPVVILENLTDAYDLSPLMPEVKSQGGQNSCTAFTIAYYLQSYNQKLEFDHIYDNSTLMSPAFLYNQANKRIYNSSLGTCNLGADLVSILTFLKENGVCTLNEMPYNDQVCDSSPNSTAITNAYVNRISEFYNIFHKNFFSIYNISAEKRINYTKANIVQGTPVIIAYNIDYLYLRNNLPPNNILTNKGNSPSAFDMHASLVVGFDDVKNAFKIINSWESDWGENGYFWMDYDYYTKYVFEAFIVDDYIASANKTPTIQTSNTITISSTLGHSGGLWINDNGLDITAKGVCWSTFPNPTIFSSKTNEGPGNFPFGSNMSGLQSNTTYFVKAYATNSFGTGYGSEQSFTTF